MSKRGLSAEEKKVKMLEIFHESADFFTMKELERLGPKLKGVITQSVKDVVQELCDDGLVCFDKIGTGNYYWSFPSAAGALKQAALTKAQKEVEMVETKIQESHASIDDAEKGREDTAERRKLLSIREDLTTQSAALKKELEAFGAADPAKYERKKAAVQICKDAAVRWTGEEWDDLRV
ncbi:hypothetical protein TREMEDRAFT_65349 [Tremella mesenterica DSM 1558]|uniref:uncharacterized protein n=1 Tax=Tremella mesenterica (strain ATCC 24925 / CBS 8224 / DSM 1558 / NBRC 9311 / NRRL Y-6157 / RJB 2259-6 / UBC 559-6) TaxID=578456 RepID=UPI00032BA8F8|nr:uncharacterized protein TREMEDRAFT_65349 [Tremella mesenterica DSM 1558]EIW66487.1 hypothetical protein TREMEDRAFT_65349 [Tremella mesenterica DSM 1558]